MFSHVLFCSVTFGHVLDVFLNQGAPAASVIAHCFLVWTHDKYSMKKINRLVLNIRRSSKRYAPSFGSFKRSSLMLVWSCWVLGSVSSTVDEGSSSCTSLTISKYIYDTRYLSVFKKWRKIHRNENRPTTLFALIRRRWTKIRCAHLMHVLVSFTRIDL